MKILGVASEGLPFSKTGGLADVVEALPKALVVQGHEVAVVLPRYRGTKATAVVMPSLTIPMGGTRLRFPAIADGTTLNGVRYYFVDDPEYFDRDGLYGGGSGGFPENSLGITNVYPAVAKGVCAAIPRGGDIFRGCRT